MEWFGLTDRGRRRPTNQDIYQIEVDELRECALLVVCDGMGGANAGNVASRFAAKVFTEQAVPQLWEKKDSEERQVLLLDALSLANSTVFTMSRSQPEYRGMGTTLVAALIQGSSTTIMNVGDSRAYLFHGERLRQVTEDHSYVEELRRMGCISAEAARNHPQKNLITRAVGVEMQVPGDLFELSLADGDVLLLCTDGLSGMVDDAQIEHILQKEQTLDQMGEALLHQALENGGRDNITVALFRRGVKKGV